MQSTHEELLGLQMVQHPHISTRMQRECSHASHASCTKLSQLSAIYKHAGKEKEY